MREKFTELQFRIFFIELFDTLFYFDTPLLFGLTKKDNWLLGSIQWMPFTYDIRFLGR